MPLELPYTFTQKKIDIKIGNHIDGNGKVCGKKF